MSHSRFRVQVEDPAGELEKIARIEKLLDDLDAEIAGLFPSTSRDRLRERFQTGRDFGIARIREACEKTIAKQAKPYSISASKVPYV